MFCRILTGTGVSLFDYLADSIAKLLHTENIKSATPIPLGNGFYLLCLVQLIFNGIYALGVERFGTDLEF